MTKAAKFLRSPLARAWGATMFLLLNWNIILFFAMSRTGARTCGYPRPGYTMGEKGCVGWCLGWWIDKPPAIFWDGVLYDCLFAIALGAVVGVMWNQLAKFRNLAEFLRAFVQGGRRIFGLCATPFRFPEL